MLTIIFLSPDGAEHRISAKCGDNLMKLAQDNAVTGIIGDCGGNCSCATCHGYIDAAWADQVPVAGEAEALMLEGALHVEANSRLTCQITVTEKMDGLIVRLPPSQN